MPTTLLLAPHPPGFENLTTSLRNTYVLILLVTIIGKYEFSIYLHTYVLILLVLLIMILSKDVVRFSNPGRLAVMWCHNLPPVVGIGLTELPNSGGAKAPPAPLLTTALINKPYVLIS